MLLFFAYVLGAAERICLILIIGMWLKFDFSTLSAEKKEVYAIAFVVFVFVGGVKYALSSLKDE
jgi:hypothetical protein